MSDYDSNLPLANKITSCELARYLRKLPRHKIFQIVMNSKGTEEIERILSSRLHLNNLNKTVVVSRRFNGVKKFAYVAFSISSLCKYIPTYYARM